MHRRQVVKPKPGPVPGFFLLAVLTGCGPGGSPADASDAPPALSIPATLEDPDIDEASGIASSRREPGLYWIHEDSGAKARLYAVDAGGNSRGRLKLEDADNDDWEDIAAFDRDGIAYLLVADTGDNDADRGHVTLYLAEEPDLTADDKPEGRPHAVIDFRYPEGPRDAEAVAVEPGGNRALLLTKRDLPPRLYEVPLDGQAEGTLTASLLATLDTLPQPSRTDIRFAPQTGDWHWQPTAMDIAPDGRALAILTYGAVYYYAREDDEDWTATLARPPLALGIRNIRDAEAIAFSHDGRALVVTVERRNAPLVRIDLDAALPK